MYSGVPNASAIVLTGRPATLASSVTGMVASVESGDFLCHGLVEPGQLLAARGEEHGVEPSLRPSRLGGQCVDRAEARDNRPAVSCGLTDVRGQGVPDGGELQRRGQPE